MKTCFNRFATHFMSLLPREQIGRRPAIRLEPPSAMFVALLVWLLWSLANAAAASPGLSPVSFTNYTQSIAGSSVSFPMIAIPGGTITVGSPDNQTGRDTNDQSPVPTTVKAFWMGAREVSWEEFVLFVFSSREDVEKDRLDGITHPTKPYGSVYRERGEKGYPAIGMSQRAATEYCKWLSKKTGAPYRLPTEAEWEYACRAGASSAYFWGDDPAQAKDYAWYKDNSKQTTQPLGQLKPNKFGLYDVVGNVAEWCAKTDPNNAAVVRGGAFSEPVTRLRCAARMIETPQWNELDPQSPPSTWWLSAADFVGLRVVRSFADGPGNRTMAPSPPAAAAVGTIGAGTPRVNLQPVR